MRGVRGQRRRRWSKKKACRGRTVQLAGPARLARLTSARGARGTFVVVLATDAAGIESRGETDRGSASAGSDGEIDRDVDRADGVRHADRSGELDARCRERRT